ncbi:MAG TPA: 2-hydroxyhepta-2,4-diene-1,7-dioate isomerase [Rhodospirillaceae bacterium]|nr:2-hydroxyhepta-2,4-diene-1,7-dioate isomerase [Magnetovibrio sp.]HBT40691.1 2-hydroxyhepta-2,4-diene-1,7-dioate isomerase [Rhodospirillaceae bacterium]|tara:strand:+ start:1150 stop:1998 length:849 start_codon:yes stop_codon:yes gene_type:complete
MKLLRYGPKGEERPGLLDAAGRIRDLSDRLPDITPETLVSDRLARLSGMDPEEFPAVGGSPRLAAPVAGVGKIIAIGLNYADHAAEAGMALPEEPIIFTKAITSLSGPTDPVVLPKGSEKGDWEAELAVVIGKRAQYVEEADALSHIAGYAVLNDVSERAFQLETTGQWVKGKSFDTFAPFGPWLVTPDEVPDPQNLRIWCEVSGQMMQDGNTKTMVFNVFNLVSVVSQYMTLMPGDIIATGTPPGVGLGMKPPRFLKAGDVMRVGIEGLGEQKTPVQAWPE